MSRQPDGGNGNGNGDVARGAGYAAFLGAALIAVAVVIGIVLLQIGDRNDNGPSATANPPTTTTSTTKPVTTTTLPNTATTIATAQRQPGAVSVVVLNGGAAAGKAGAMADALKVKGYKNMGEATDWPKHQQTGNRVYCRAGLDREGAALTVAVGGNPKLIVPFTGDGAAPPNPDNRDCVVVVGTPG
jgi:hypothetical protein